MTKPKLSAERARELFSYDPETGELRWRVSRGRVKVGDLVGHQQPDGYRSTKVDRSGYWVHRVVWLISCGSWPKGDLDHINGDPSDNRLVNLRDVSHRVNLENRRSATRASKAGVLGVITPKRGRCRARITLAGVSKDLGGYDTAQEAHEAYLTAKRELHAGCTL